MQVPQMIWLSESKLPESLQNKRLNLVMWLSRQDIRKVEDTFLLQGQPMGHLRQVSVSPHASVSSGGEGS